MASSSELKWQTLTAAINEVKNPASFLRNLLFTRTELVPTNTIELSFWNRGRKVAPFVRRGRAGVMVEGHTEKFQNVSLPHIRIKRPMTPSELLDKRRPGTPIFVDNSQMSSAIAKYLAREVQNLDDDISNAEEWMVSQAITGKISYTDQENESFTVTFPRSASHDVTLTGTNLWTNAASSPRKDCQTVSELMMDDVSLTPTICILGKDAAEAFVNNVEVLAKLNQNNPFSGGGLRAGTLDLTAKLAQSGALYLGTLFQGIDFWRYNRQLTLADGTVVDLIRPDRAEFIAVDAAADWLTYYGPIVDLRAFGDSTPRMSQRFSKSWETEDPSARWILAESNPLPCPRRPDACFSMKVV